MGKALRVVLLSVNREQDPQPVYPLGLEHIGQACARAGFETLLLDCNVIPDLDQLIGRILNFKPRFVLVSLRNVDSIESVETRYYLPELIEVIRCVAKIPGSTLILGGSGYSLFPREILKLSGAEYGVRGAGESIIAELLMKLDQGSDVSQTAGLVYRKDGEITMNPPVPTTVPAGSSSRCAELVAHYWGRGAQMNVQSKRGCPYVCTYCTYPGLEGCRVVERPIDQVVDEIESLRDKHGITSFFMVDNVFNVNPETTDAFAHALIRRNLRISWTGYFVPKDISAERAELWKASGLSAVEFGADTLSVAMLKSYRKSFELPDVFEAARACRQADLPYSVYLLLGGPGETNGTLDESIANCEKLEKAVFFVLYGVRIYPGTALHQYAVAQEYISADRNLLSPCFYLSPELDAAYLERRMAELGRRPNWCIIGHGMDAKRKSAAVLRKYGYRGALWEQCIA